MKLPFVFDDGGRKKSRFKGEANDCVCRAIAIAAEMPYKEVYALINSYRGFEKLSRRERMTEAIFKNARSSARGGVRKQTSRSILNYLGFVWVPTMAIGTGCKVHLRQGELPMGRIIARVSRHLVAVIDGVIHDTHDCGRKGTRCVYGYYYRPQSTET